MSFYRFSPILLLTLTACVNIPQNQPLYVTIDNSSKVLLSEKDTRWMHQANYDKLKKFIETAPPNAIMCWKSRTTNYKATSLSIFLNDTGQPCRQYHFSSQSPLTESIDTTETACRNTSGTWVRLQPLNHHA